MRAWLASWRLAARIARRDARRHKARTALIVAMLMLPALAGSVALVVSASSVATPQTKVNQTLGSFAQARIEWNEPTCPMRQTADAGERACVAAAESDQTGLSVREVAGLLDSDARIVAGTQQRVTLRLGDSARPMSDVTQIDAHDLTGIVSVTAGRLPGNAGEVLLEPSVARDLGAAVGAHVTLRTDAGEEIAATVSGLGSMGGDVTLIVAAPGTLPDGADVALQSLAYVLDGPPVEWATVQRLDAHGYVTFSRAVVLDPPPDVPKPGSLFPTDQSGSDGTLLAGFGALGVLEVALMIGPAFAVGARRSRRTLALLAATGATPRDLGRVVRATGLLFGGLAGLFGTVFGAGGAAIAVGRAASPSLPNLVMPWPLLIAIAVATALFGAAAAWLPGRSVARLDPAGSLRESPNATARRSPVPWPGLAVLGLGCLGAGYGATKGDSTTAMAGGVVALVGIVLLAGWLVWLTSRFAPRSGVAGRLALRDADRHRSRTAPALAAVIACVAGGTMAIGFTVSANNAVASVLHPILGDGLVSIADNASGAVTGEQALRSVVDRAESMAPMAASLPVRVVAGGAERKVGVKPQCPGVKAADFLDTPGPCLPQVTGYVSRQGQWSGPDPFDPDVVIVDDGAMIAKTGLPSADTAADALRSGHVLVNDRALIDANGETSVRVKAWRAGHYDAGSLFDKTVHVAARYVPWQSHLYQLVIPPELAKRLDVDTWLSGYLLVPDGQLTGRQRARIDGLSASGANAAFGIQVRVAAPEQASPITLLVLSTIAALIAAGATWIAVGLARADSRADLATLAAVGASPGTRRRFAGAQAAVIAAVGAAIGTGVGLAMLWVVVRVEGSNVSDGSVWAMDIPWLPQVGLAVGVPVVAVIGAMLATRSRLPAVTRRLT